MGIHADTTSVPGVRLSDVARSIKPSGIRKFFDLVGSASDVISLGIGEPDLAVPIEVRMATVSALVQGNTHYSPNAGFLQLRQAIAWYLEEHVSLAFDPQSEILVTAGVAEGVDLALRALVNPGDDVLLPEPCFVSYEPCVRLAGGNPVPIPLGADTGFRLTPEILESHLTRRARVLLLNYPNNPTGAVMTREQLGLLLPLIHLNDLTVISDEIYSELSYDRSHCSIAALPDMKERTILLNGFSKTFSMTGLRLGYAAGPQAIIDGMARIHQHSLMCASTLAQVAGLKALHMVESVTATAREVYGYRREVLHAALTAAGLPSVKPGGSFFAFPSVLNTGMTDEEFARHLLAEDRVVVVPGSAFGDSGKGHIRISYACAQLEEALERITRFVQRHRFG